MCVLASGIGTVDCYCVESHGVKTPRYKHIVRRYATVGVIVLW